jgi:hypothetical protein
VGPGAGRGCEGTLAGSGAVATTATGGGGAFGAVSAAGATFLGAVTGLFAGAALTTGLTAGGDGLGGASLAGAALTGGFGENLFCGLFQWHWLGRRLFDHLFRGRAWLLGAVSSRGAGLPFFFGAGLEAGLFGGCRFFRLAGRNRHGLSLGRLFLDAFGFAHCLAPGSLQDQPSFAFDIGDTHAFAAACRARIAEPQCERYIFQFPV